MVKMNERSTSLKISGPLLSKIFHESYCNEGYCGGMLFGEVLTITKNEITDSDHRTSEHSTICVQDYQPMRQKRSFFINDQSAESVSLKSVGFYRIRTSTNRLSLLEKSMHKSLGRHSHSPSKDKIVTLLINYDEHTDLSCLSWKLRAYIQKYNGEFSVVKVHVSNLQGSVLNSYVRNPNPLSDVLPDGACATLNLFQSSVSERMGKIKLVDSTRDVTIDLITELEQTVDEFDRQQLRLEKCYKEKLLLSQQLQHLAAQVNDLEYRKSHRRSSAQLYSSKLQSRQSDLEVTAAPNVPPRLGDNYERMQQQNPEDGKLKSPVVLKMIDLTSELQKASQALRLPDVSAHGEAASAPEETGQSDSNVDNDLIRFDDTA